MAASRGTSKVVVGDAESDGLAEADDVVAGAGEVPGMIETAGGYPQPLITRATSTGNVRAALMEKTTKPAGRRYTRTSLNVLVVPSLQGGAGEGPVSGETGAG
jgi:hypothetical protein